MLRPAAILGTLLAPMVVLACGGSEATETLVPEGVSAYPVTEDFAYFQVESRCGGIQDDRREIPDYDPSSRGYWENESYLRWWPDGTQVMFNFSWRYEGPTRLQRVTLDGSKLRTVELGSGVPVWRDSAVMTHFDVSPDSSRIAYSTCALIEIPTSEEDDRAWIYDYEIVLSSIDGTEVKRLTENTHFDNFPVWSPDGRSIAFISEPGGPFSNTLPYQDVRGQLSIYTPAAGELRSIVPDLPGWVAPHRLAWSPDGTRIAFVAREGEGSSPNNRAVYTIGIDESGLTRISDASSGPAWSPDGSHIAVAVPVGGDASALYAFDSDGSSPVLLDDGLPETWMYPVKPWLGNLSWSPDGSEILFDGLVHKVALDDSSPASDLSADLKMVFPDAVPLLAAWSPDGSQVAMLTGELDGDDGGIVAYIIDRDGSNPRALAKHLGYDHFIPLSSPELVDLDAEPCLNGITVHAPRVNPGLVQDCLALLELREKIPGFSPDWSYDSHIAEWGGVVLEYGNHRVGLLVFRGSGLSGPLTTEIVDTLASLTELTYLGLSSNNLSGSIPPELGNLANLESLDLGGNQLSGPIPPELGNLANLESLDLGGNQLSGPIPPELGNLGNLESLDLGDNQLTGPIPPELANAVSLGNLRLDHNRLSGRIPPELGNLEGVVALRLDHNPLSGRIPPELGNLANLWTLDLSSTNVGGSIPPEMGGLVDLRDANLEDTNVGGCVPAELPAQWLFSLRLEGVESRWLEQERCDLDEGSVPYDLGLCSAGMLVHDPAANPGLVQDCRVLVEILNNSFIDDSFQNYRDLSWNIRGPISGWNGVRVGGLPPRVRVLEMEVFRPSAPTSFPVGIAKLSKLHWLHISGRSLIGEIPPELGNLKQLVGLALYHTSLSGPIPPELGNLTKLEQLYLSHTDISGPIPQELAGLVNLRELDLRGTNPSGCIPAELPEIWVTESGLQRCGPEGEGVP